MYIYLCVFVCIYLCVVDVVDVVGVVGVVDVVGGWLTPFCCTEKVWVYCGISSQAKVQIASTADIYDLIVAAKPELEEVKEVGTGSIKVLCKIDGKEVNTQTLLSALSSEVKEQGFTLVPRKYLVWFALISVEDLSG